MAKKLECRNPRCGYEPAYWVEWKAPDKEERSRETKPICAPCSEHLKHWAARKGMSAFLVLVPLEQVNFPF
jgi:hypothetical protein